MNKTVIYEESAVLQRIAELGEEISASYDGPVLCVCVLKGAFMFFSELVKRIKGELYIDFIRVSSYINDRTCGNVRLVSDITESVADRHVLIVEDIVDSGYTVSFLRSHFAELGAKSVKVACLFDKPMTRKVDVKVDFKAFTLDKPRFIVGFGLDYDQKYRCDGFVSEVELGK